MRSGTTTLGWLSTDEKTLMWFSGKDGKYLHLSSVRSIIRWTPDSNFSQDNAIIALKRERIFYSTVREGTLNSARSGYLRYVSEEKIACLYEKHLHLSSVTSIIRGHQVRKVQPERESYSFSLIYMTNQAQCSLDMICKNKVQAVSWTNSGKEQPQFVAIFQLMVVLKFSSDSYTLHAYLLANAGNIGRSAISSLNFPPIVAVELCRKHLIESDEDVLWRADVRETKEELAFRGKKFLDWHRSYTSRKSVAPVRNRILVYPDSDEEDEDYCSLPPLLSCFQTPQPCVPTQGFTSQFFNQSPNPPLDKKDSLDEILDDLFKIGTENIRKMELEVTNRCDDITDYEDSDQEDGELLDFPTFPATNEFASVCEQGEDNIDFNTAQELEEVQVEDVEMDEDYDIDHSNTKEAIQWSPAQDPFLVVLELDVQSSFLLHTIPSSISNEVKREFTTPHMYKFWTSYALPVAYLHPYGSHSKEMEFEVTSTHNHVGKKVFVWA
ncbi:hypothetical protein Tco_0245868 [Tanacetum coccineum]